MEPAKQVAEWIKRDPDAADASWIREIKATWGSTFEEAREILSEARQLVEPQLDVFALDSPPVEPPRARTADPDTSHDAAASMLIGNGLSPAAEQRWMVLGVVVKNPQVNSAEIDQLAGRPDTAHRRLCELERAGYVRRLEIKRKTPRGRDAYLYEATARGVSLIENGQPTDG